MRIYIWLSLLGLLLMKHSRCSLSPAIMCNEQHVAWIFFETIITREIFISERAYGRNAIVFFSPFDFIRLTDWIFECRECETNTKLQSPNIVVLNMCRRRVYLCSVLCFGRVVVLSHSCVLVHGGISAHVIHVGRLSTQFSENRCDRWDRRERETHF